MRSASAACTAEFVAAVARVGSGAGAGPGFGSGVVGAPNRNGDGECATVGSEVVEVAGASDGGGGASDGGGDGAAVVGANEDGAAVVGANEVGEAEVGSAVGGTAGANV